MKFNKKIGSTFAVALAFCAALFAAGCMDQGAEPGEPETVLVTEENASELGVADIGIAASASFFATCRNPWVVFEVSTGHALEAGASGCRRRNGTYSTNPYWIGRCTGDVSNCDGRIVCQATCP